MNDETTYLGIHVATTRENEQLLAEQTRLVDVLYSIWVNGTMDDASLHDVEYALERYPKTVAEIEAYSLPRAT